MIAAAFLCLLYSVTAYTITNVNRGLLCSEGTDDPYCLKFPENTLGDIQVQREWRTSHAKEHVPTVMMASAECLPCVAFSVPFDPYALRDMLQACGCERVTGIVQAHVACVRMQDRPLTVCYRPPCPDTFSPDEPLDIHSGWFVPELEPQMRDRPVTYDDYEGEITYYHTVRPGCLKCLMTNVPPQDWNWRELTTPVRRCACQEDVNIQCERQLISDYEFESGEVCAKRLTKAIEEAAASIMFSPTETASVTNYVPRSAASLSQSYFTHDTLRVKGPVFLGHVELTHPEVLEFLDHIVEYKQAWQWTVQSATVPRVQEMAAEQEQARSEAKRVKCREHLTALARKVPSYVDVQIDVGVCD